MSLSAIHTCFISQSDGGNLCRALSSAQSVSIHPSSVLFGTKPECVVFNELVRTNRSYIRNLTQIDSLWLPELAPLYFSAQEVSTASRLQ